MTKLILPNSHLHIPVTGIFLSFRVQWSI